MDRSGGADEGRLAPRQDHRGASGTRPRSAVIPARATAHLRLPSRRRAVPGVRDNDPYGRVGGPKCVLVPDLSNVTELSYREQASYLAGYWQEETPPSIVLVARYSGKSGRVKTLLKPISGLAAT